jgi:hypothetical protein
MSEKSGVKMAKSESNESRRNNESEKRIRRNENNGAEKRKLINGEIIMCNIRKAMAKWL